MNAEISLKDIVVKGMFNGWWSNCKARYRVYKGARNTGKSYNLLGYEIIDKIVSDPRRNVMIIRNTFATHKFSTFSTLLKIISNPVPDNPEINLSNYFSINKQDLTITYKPTGQVILFRGFDDPAKIASVRVVYGFLTDIYVEEAFEIKDYEAWRIADGSFRANKYFPDDLFIQITLVLNGWNIGHWIYDVFFKDRLEDDKLFLLNNDYMDYYDPNIVLGYGKGLYLHISTYKMNSFRAPEYDVAMEELRKVAPKIYEVEALGMWGSSSASTYPEFNDGLIKKPFELMKQRYSRYAIGVDTGLSDGAGHIRKGTDIRIRSATTMQLMGLSQDYEKLFAIDEYFYSNETEMIKKTEPELMSEIIDKIIYWKEKKYLLHPDLMKRTILVYVDNADIGFRQGLELEARRKGLMNIRFEPSTKTTIQNRVDFQRLIMAYGEYLYSSECPNLIRETRNARHGGKGEVREDIDDHALTASEYAVQSFVNQLKRYKQFKEH